MARIRIGISGWTYPGWRGDFYPRGLPARRELAFASRRFDTIEINGSFYSLQRPESYVKWRRATPAGFRFAVKGSRFITHNRKLRRAESAMANFFASGVLRLEEKLGPILWQLSSTLAFDEERLVGFVEMLPRTTRAAADLAGRHDDRVAGRGSAPVMGNHRIRHAIEPRHASWFTAAFAQICRRHGIAIVISESADWPLTEEITAGFVYVRLHGSRETYASRYTDAELDRWAERIHSWSAGAQPRDAAKITDRKPPAREGRDVFVYFDNDAKVNAPKDAARLARRLGVGPEDANDDPDGAPEEDPDGS